MKSKDKKAEYKEGLRERLAAYLKSHGMRQTHERFAILEKIVDYGLEFDIETIYANTIKEYHVSKTTVYNTVALLCDCNILIEYRINAETATYELSDIKHLHLICDQCGSIKKVTDSKVNDFITSKKFRGFSPSYSTIYIHGICSKCKRKKSSNK